jgi:hypothetical protein
VAVGTYTAKDDHCGQQRSAVLPAHLTPAKILPTVTSAKQRHCSDQFSPETNCAMDMDRSFPARSSARHIHGEQGGPLDVLARTVPHLYEHDAESRTDHKDEAPSVASLNTYATATVASSERLNHFVLCSLIHVLIMYYSVAPGESNLLSERIRQYGATGHDHMNAARKWSSGPHVA